MTTQIDVTMHGRQVATITNIPGDTNVVAIDPDFAADDNAPTLSLKAFRDPVTGRYREQIRPTRTAAHPFFANLLPEGPRRTYLAKLGRVKPMRDFPLLWLLGSDLPGALVLRNADGDMLPPRDDDTTGAERTPEGDRIFRFSLAGVQLKFSASGDPTRGLTIRMTNTEASTSTC